MRRGILTCLLMAFCLLLFGTWSEAGAQKLKPSPQAQVLMPGIQIPKYIDPLPGPGPITVVDTSITGPAYNIYMMEFPAQVLPSRRPGNLKPFPMTKVWGYRTDADILQANRQTYIGPVVIAQRGLPVNVTYSNNLFYGNNLLSPSTVQPLLPTDLTIPWANPFNIICSKDKKGNINDPACLTLPTYLNQQPAIPHIHGGEVPPGADGGPESWFTPNQAYSGPGAPPMGLMTYDNMQEASTIWFHDHALGITRLNVYAGMAGMYIIQDTNEPAGLPTGAYDIPLVIQDRSFDTNGQIFYNLASNPQPNPSIHPFWIPEFLGDSIVVNGKTWPYLNVEPRKYRFRLLNGSQARFYNLTLENGLPFTVIATDGGYLNSPDVVPSLLIAPGERYEVVVDFSGLPVGSRFRIFNNGATPYPAGLAPVPGVDALGEIIQFRVVATGPTSVADPGPVPLNLRPAPIVNLSAHIGSPGTFIKRQLTLNETLGKGGPLGLVLNNTDFSAVVNGFTNRETERPAVGDTEMWEIINISADAHPIHLHLVQFQLLNRQAFNTASYLAAYGAPAPGMGPPTPYLSTRALGPDFALGGNPLLSPHLLGNPIPAPAFESGWKDTIVAMPGEVTRILVRWAPTDAPTPDPAITQCAAGPFEQPGIPFVPQDYKTTPCYPAAGSNLYPFDPTKLVNNIVGYVWHCHILEHEDNDMMRPYVVGTARQ